MKSLLSILLFFALLSVASAQINTDSIKQKIDSLQLKLPQLPDSLLPSFHKVDSIRNAFNQEAETLKGEYQESVSKIDAVTSKLNHTIDSLKNLRLPTTKYTRKLDSLNQIRQKTVGNFNSKVESLKTKTTDKLKGLDLPPQYNEPLQQFTSKVDGFGLDTDFVKIPQLDIPGYSLPKIDGLGDLTSKAGEIGNIGNLGSLPKIETPVGELGQVGEQLKGVQEDIKNVTSGNLNDVQQLPKTLEEQAGKIDGVEELQKSSGVVDGYKDKLENLSDPNKAKEQVAEMAKEAAIDHFAGKQEQLKKAMDQISKYKQKYSSVSSLKDLPKRPPNAMKGKPFIERIVPGLYFQYQQKNYNQFDINPYAGYRIVADSRQAQAGTIVTPMTEKNMNGTIAQEFLALELTLISNSVKASSRTWKRK